MYLHQAMSKAKSKVPQMNRMGKMGQVDRTLSGAQAGLKKMGNVSSQGKYSSVYMDKS